MSYGRTGMKINDLLVSIFIIAGIVFVIGGVFMDRPSREIDIENQYETIP